MTTEAQLNANRRNAQKSTGPRTDEGKQTVAQNAVKHGFHSAQALLADEDPQAFDQFSRHLRAELNPIGPMEIMLVERIVILSWRLQRSVRLQSGVCDVMTIQACRDDNAPDQTTLFSTVAHDFKYNRILDNLLRHETRLEKSLYKTMLELQRLQFIRTKYQSLLLDRQDYDEMDVQAMARKQQYDELMTELAKPSDEPPQDNQNIRPNPPADVL